LFNKTRAFAGHRPHPKPARTIHFQPLEGRILCSTTSQDPSLVSWFTADSIAASSGAPVANWNDSSGNGFTARQATPARQPTYIANGIGVHAAVRFDAAESSQLAFTRPVSTDFTLMVVFRSTQGIGNAQSWFTGAGLIDGEVNGVTNDFGLSLNAAGQLLGGTGKPDTTAASGVGFNDGRPHVATFTRSAATGALTTYVDGKRFAQTTGGTQALTAASRLTIGSLQTNLNYFTGDIADVRVYSIALPDATRSSVESSLEATYGIAPPAARTFTNPVINANFPDPGVIKAGPTYYVFATNTGGRNAPVVTSTDLAHWSNPTEALPTLPTWAKSGRTWAPYVARMADGIHYNIYYTAWSKTDGRQHIGVGQSTNPKGPFTAIGSTPFVDQASLGGAIDSSVFTESDGRRYLVWKNDGNAIGQITNVYIQQLASDGLSFVGSATPLLHNDQPWEGSLIEAPEILEHDDKYYLFYSANGYGSSAYAIGYASSSSLTGPYTKAPGPWVNTVGNVIGPGGESFTVGPDGNTWMLYHSWENNFAYRSMSADQVIWKGDVPVLRGPSRVEQPVPTAIRTAPTLTSARRDALATYASGSLSSVANTRFMLQFFSTPTPGGVPEFIGSAPVTSDASGHASFRDVSLAPAPPGQLLTVMATDASGESSPQSATIAIHWTGDINGDGSVDFNDLVLLAQHYNAPATAAQGDINGDGMDDFNDLVLLAQNYNTIVPPPAPAMVTSDAPTSSILQSDPPSDVLVKVERRPAKRKFR
jgi:GH43 family beta-xylosidase